MKKLAIFMAAVALVCAGCSKEKEDENSSSTEVGKWYAYNTADSKEDVAYVLELKADGTADFIISAWGERWQGTYTYDGKVVKLTYNKFLVRDKAWVLGNDATSPEHLDDWWVDFALGQNLPEGDYDPDEFGKTLSISFTYKGDKGEINIANKPCPAERQK